MKGFILIIAMSFPTSACFALSFSKAHPQPVTTTVTVSRSVSVKTPSVTSAPVAVPSASATSSAAADQSRLARVTVYWASGGRGSDRYTRKHKTATGARLRSGHCAVDPRHIPYGSKVVLPDGSSLAAVDTGTAVKNRKAARKAGRTPNERNAIVIDRFFETKRQALAWAKTHPLFMPIKVVSPKPVRRLTSTPTTLAFNSTSPVMKAQAVSATSASSGSERNPLSQTRR